MQNIIEKERFAKKYFINLDTLPTAEKNLLLNYIEQDCGGVGPSVNGVIDICVESAIKFCSRNDLGTWRPGLDAVATKKILEVIKQAGVDVVEYRNYGTWYACSSIGSTTVDKGSVYDNLI